MERRDRALTIKKNFSSSDGKSPAKTDQKENMILEEREEVDLDQIEVVIDNNMKK